MTPGNQQKIEDQREITIALAATFTVQCVAWFTVRDLIWVLLPAIGLGIVTTVLTLRSEKMLWKLRRKRRLLAGFTLGLAVFVALTMLIESPRSPLLMQLSRFVMVDFVFFFLGRLCGSLIGGDRKTQA